MFCVKYYMFSMWTEELLGKSSPQTREKKEHSQMQRDQNLNLKTGKHIEIINIGSRLGNVGTVFIQ